jgi:hypothetical protein
MTPSKRFLTKLGLKDPEPSHDNNADTHNSRRSFLKRSALGGIALGGISALWPVEDIIAQATQKVSRLSNPSDLRITDMRYCIIQNVGRTPIIRIDTNQYAMAPMSGMP